MAMPTACVLLGLIVLVAMNPLAFKGIFAAQVYPTCPIGTTPDAIGSTAISPNPDKTCSIDQCNAACPLVCDEFGVKGAPCIVYQRCDYYAPLDACEITCASCVSSGSVHSDPVMTGFDGSIFEFFGKPSFNYSVLSHTAVSVNMLLVPAGPKHVRLQPGEGTFVGSMAVLLPNLELIAHVDEAGEMEFTINGTSADNHVPGIWDDVAYEPYKPNFGQIITVTHFPFQVTITAVKAYTDAESGYNRGHIDMNAMITGPLTSAVAGILGQTLGATTANCQEDDCFMVPSLTTHAFVPATMITSRQLRSISVSHMFPLYASVHAR